MKKFKIKSILVLLAVMVSAIMFTACNDTAVNLKLAELKANDVTLTLTDGEYVHTVDYEVEKLTLSATAEDNAATVEGLGEKTLKAGENVFTVTVKASGKSENYTVKIVRSAANLGLGEVKIGNDVLTAGTDGNYVLSVGNDVKTVNLTATAAKAYATVEGTGEKTLNVGENAFTLTVKAGESAKNYTVKVVRAAADLGLSEVKIGDNVLTAGADGTYRHTVANTVTEVTLTATASNEKATVEGAGVKENLVVGENGFAIKVSVGEESKTYSVIITREKSAVNTVESITVNDISATFDETENAYLVTINRKSATVVVTLTSDVSSYTLTPAIGELEEDENEFTITVTAENGATADYLLIINVVLPTYRVSYTGDVEGAVTNEGFTYKHGEEQMLNIALAEKYSQSYDKITVTYKVGDGAEKTVKLDENYGFTVPAEEAIGDITVKVSGIAINVYTITYHRNGSTSLETVKYGENAVKNAITPNTEVKDVLDGYVYTHYERWVTEDGGNVTANLENITENKDVYYKDDVLVRREVAYYAPMDGLITYYTINQMNGYVVGDKNGDVEFLVLIKSTAIDGTTEEEGKTSFVIYGTATWNAANELGVSVKVSELNKWFRVKATAEDKKVTVYRPDGTVASEKTFESYAADTISLAMHANVAVAAVNPTIPELCTVVYNNEKGEEIHREKVIKGSAATYEYTKADEELGDGYTKQYINFRWLGSNNETVDLTTVTANVTVKLAYDTLVIKNKVVAKSDTKLTAINRFITVGSDGKITFRVRINDTGWAGFNIVAAGGYVGLENGVVAGDGYIVSIDTATGEILVFTESGAVKGLNSGAYNPTATALSDILICLSDGTPDFKGNFDLAAINADVVRMEFYDSDKTTLLKTDLVVRGNLNYVYSSDADSEGYVKTVNAWLPMEGSENKVYAAKTEYVRNQSTFGSNVNLLETNKYASVDAEGKITFKIRVAATGWTGVNVIISDNNYVMKNGGLTTDGTVWLTVTIDVATGDIIIANENGEPFGLNKDYYKGGAVSIENVAVCVSGASYEISVVK